MVTGLEQMNAIEKGSLSYAAVVNTVSPILRMFLQRLQYLVSLPEWQEKWLGISPTFLPSLFPSISPLLSPLLPSPLSNFGDLQIPNLGQVYVQSTTVY